MSVREDRGDQIGRPLRRFYDFGAYRIDTLKRLLLKDGEIVALTPKAFDTLLLLVEKSGRLVTKDELMSRLWPDTVVEEGSLTRNIYLLRKALGEERGQNLYIATVPGQGYRFVADVREISEESLDLRVTERTRTTIVVSEEDSEEEGDSEEEEDAGEELIAIPAASDSAGQHFIAPSHELQALEAQSRQISPAGGKGWKDWKAITILALVLIAAVSAAAWLYGSRKLSRNEPGPLQPSPEMVITNLTTTGDIVCAGISPDGNYVAYAKADNVKQSSLWVMQLATFTSQSVIPSAEVQYHSLSFSPDGNYIYYIMWAKNNAQRDLYRVSLLGGPSKKLLDRVETAVGFSPDGKQIAFRRGLHDRRESALFIANSDGTGEREIATVKYPEGLGDPAWSPDGKLIVCAAGHTSGGANKYVLEVSVDDGTAKPIPGQKWRWISHLSWLSDSSGLMMIASRDPAAPYQIWHLSYPSGEARKISNDSNQYYNLSMSADSDKVVALQSQLDTKVWTIPADDTDRAKQVTFGAGGHRGKISWTPSGKIVYDSSVGNFTAISIMDADGSNPRNLMGDMTGRAIVGNSTVSLDGRFIVYSSDLTGTRHIWRMDLDGSDHLRLTEGGGEDHPTVTPDGNWVIYTDVSSEEYRLWRVPIDGGQPEQLIDAFVNYPTVSPDGKLIACFLVEPTSPIRLAVFSIETRQPVKVFPDAIRGSSSPRWTPDGRGITYGENYSGTSKLWIQPLDGRQPRKLIELDTDRIFDFAWSPDGKQIACIRGILPRNIVLVKNFR